MLEVTRLNGSIYFLNPDLILTIEQTPDTIITLTNGDKVMVREDAHELVARFKKYQHEVHTGRFEVKEYTPPEEV